MKALSIRQPWCHHILHDGKDVENRDWATRFRGIVLIHASLSEAEDRELIRREKMPRGGIVGVMEILDCVNSMESRWFNGPYGFVIGRRHPIDLIPCTGALGFFTVRPDIAAIAEMEIRL